MYFVWLLASSTSIGRLGMVRKSNLWSACSEISKVVADAVALESPDSSRFLQQETINSGTEFLSSSKGKKRSN